MKYLKLFENKTLDDILDKMSLHGKESLSKLELDYLNSFQSGNQDKVKKELDRESNLKSVTKYDPRNDNDYYKKMGMSFSEWSDDDIEEGKLYILWNELTPDEMSNFLKSNDLDDKVGELPWDKLSDDNKELFELFLYENDLLKTKKLEETEIEILWEEFNKDKMERFLTVNRLPFSLIELSWDKLPNEVKNIFTKYVKKNNLI